MLLQKPPGARLALTALLALSALLCLSGCGGEPSSGDIEKAVKSFREQRSQELRQISGSASGADSMPRFHGAKKLGCTNAQGGAAYTCDVELDMTEPYGGARSKRVTQFRLVKGSDGWMMTR